MQSRPKTKDIALWAGQPLILVAREIDDATGDPVVGSNISYASLQINDLDSSSDATPVYSEGPIEATSVWYDTLQTGHATLLGDSDGYNFKLIIDDARYTFRGGRKYRVQVISAYGASSIVYVYNVTVGATL